MNATTDPPFADALARVQRYGLIAGAVGALLAVLGVVLAGPTPFFQGYLAAYMFWVGLSLGCLALLMLHHLVAGAWGFVTERLLEAGALTIGLMAVLFVPFFFGLDALYPWTDRAYMLSEPALAQKMPYLNAPFFIVRAVVCFAFWTGAAYVLAAWSRRLDETRDAGYARRLKILGTAGLIGHILLNTFASVDWIMSLEPHWYSTIFGWMLTVSQVLTALAFTALVLARGREAAPLRGVVRAKHLHDYGNLMLAFVILWTYMMFAQFLIIWAGNLPEDVAWYEHRAHGGWLWAGVFLVVFHFAVPFFLLLSRRTKRSVRGLSALAAGLLAVHLVFLGWLVIPSFEGTRAPSYWIAGAAFVGLGGLWSAAYAWLLARRPLLPTGDPRFQAMLEHQRHEGG